MIVRKSSKGLHIIYQAAHGLLAGKIAHELKLDYRSDRWLDTLIAIVEHDDHQLDFKEKKYLSELGIPMDFTENETSVDKILKRAERVIGQAKSKSLWTAMLVSFHLDFLYGDLRQENEKARQFLKSQDTFRNDTISHFGIGKKKAEAVYELLRFCDRCSLILCKDEIPDGHRKLEINTAIAQKTYFIREKGNGKISVEPWCFEKSEFTVSVEETLVERPKFKNQKEFHDVLEKSERTALSWNFEQ